MKQYYLFLIFCITLLFAHSQDLLITHNGDTLHGDVKFMGKYISITQSGKPDSTYAADNIAYIKTGRYKGTVLHCSLAIYSDNIDVVQKWNFNGEIKRDTVLVLYEIFSTPKMKLFEVADKDRSIYYFIKKPTDSLPIQMIVRYAIWYPDPYVHKIAVAKTEFISLAQQR